MTGSLDTATARRRYITVCALFWLPLGLSLAPLILLLTERGLTTATIAGLFAAHSLTAAALELPTGGLADVLGRRAVLIGAGLLNLTALVLVGLGSAPWLLALGMVLMGAGRALSSGPAEAWYVDAVHADAGPGADLRPGLAGGSSATSAALAAGTLLGGALPWLLGVGPDLGARLREASSGLVLPLSVPLLLGTAVEIAFVLYVVTALPEPPRPPAALRDVLRGIPATVAGGLRLGGRDTLVRRVFLSAGAAGSALVTIELLMPGRAAAVTGAPESGAVLFAVLACAGFICSGFGSHLAPLTARLAGSGERAVMVSLGAGASGLLLLAATAASTGAGALALSVTGYGLLYLGLGAAGPSQNDILHRRVTSGGRATALSVQSLALQLVGALTGLVVGVLRPGPVPWLLGGTVLLAGSLLWVRRSGLAASVPEAAKPQPPAGSPSVPAEPVPFEI
ncbi:MFS transporter [Streptomyces xanthophaeus]|uniref:MFS transporter n=1 Tax=Streptomyces xanthophaeus TaxID=67385 RepID=UPI00264740F6|nr:MFS transporter [Streptomyces xanthophaeus]WKD36626.1 MFS transporter [Streptomyces xanthophaeus]